MRLFLLALFTFLFTSTSSAKLTNYAPDLIPMTDTKAHKLLSTNGSPDFWALDPFYLRQNPAHCGTYSMIMVVNAYAKGVKAEIDNWFDKDVEKIITRSKVERGGHTLDQMGEVLKAKLGAGFSVEVKRPQESELEKFIADLKENEKSEEDFIILNYLQNKVNDIPEDVNNDVGHISPVGAYNADKKLVLVMDVDREYFVPYWAPVKKVFNAMVHFKDSATGKTRGYVYVKRNH